MLPREPASQSHLLLHHAVTVSPHQSRAFHWFPVLTCTHCLRRHGQHVRNIAEELDPTFRTRRPSAERDQEDQTGTVNRRCWNNRPTLTSSLCCRPGRSHASHAAARVPGRAHFHPSHKAANRQVGALQTQREEGKLQAAVILVFSRSVNIHPSYSNTIKHPYRHFRPVEKRSRDISHLYTHNGLLLMLFLLFF